MHCGALRALVACRKALAGGVVQKADVAEVLRPVPGALLPPLPDLPLFDDIFIFSHSTIIFFSICEMNNLLLAANQDAVKGSAAKPG